MEQTNEPIIKKERKAAWRWGEGGKYNNKPTSEAYFRDYYREKLAIKVQCPLCGNMVVKQKLQRHQTTKMCHNRSTTSSTSSGSESC